MNNVKKNKINENKWSDEKFMNNGQKKIYEHLLAHSAYKEH